MYESLPGGEILSEGFLDLANGIVSVPGQLLLAAEPRLNTQGIRLPENFDRPPIPEHALHLFAEARAWG